jgi:hypothetical protein
MKNYWLNRKSQYLSISVTFKNGNCFLLYPDNECATVGHIILIKCESTWQDDFTHAELIAMREFAEQDPVYAKKHAQNIQDWADEVKMTSSFFKFGLDDISVST